MKQYYEVKTGAIRMLGCLALMVGLLVSTMAQPPSLIHYQGRLTTNLGAPITTPQTVFFSLWRGGSSGAASSGEQFYAEQATVSPDANGIFEHQIGSGGSVTGSLDAAQFDTAEAVHLQLAVGTASAVLLPRSVVTSVGYAFVAGDAVGDIHPTSVSIEGAGEVIDSSGNWTGSQDGLVGPSGNPQVASVTDSTGGMLVVGDKLQIDGSALSDALVLVGGREAPILSQTASRIVCRVPAAVPSGLNAVEVVSDATGGPSVPVAHVDVHRLLIWLTPGSGNTVHVIDPRTQTIVQSLDVPFGIDTDKMPIQIAFAFEGAVAIIPENNGSSLQAIDLTANPPALLGSAQSSGSGVEARAVAVSPESDIVVVVDYDSNRLRMAPLTDSPTDIFGSFSTIDEFPTGFNGPRALTFIGSTLLLTCGELSGEIVALRRDPATNIFEFREFNDPGNPNLRNRISAGVSPFSIRPTLDRTRVLVTNAGSSNVLCYYVAPEGLSNTVSSTNGGNALAATMDPTGTNVYVADDINDVVRTIFLTGGKLDLVGDIEGPDGSTENFQMAAVEPGSGRFLAVSTDDSRVFIFSRMGASLSPLGFVSVSQSDREAYALEFQP